MVRTKVVSSREIGEAGGVLDAHFYVDRQPGETYEQWKLRKEIDKRFAQLERSLRRLGVQLEQIKILVKERYGGDDDA